MTVATAAKSPPSPPTQKTVVVPPFGVRACHPQMCDLALQSIPGCRLRSEIKQTSMTIRGEVRAPTLSGRALPSVSGMELHINPAALSYAIVDPLHANEAEQRALAAFLKATSGVDPGTRNVGLQTQNGNLDANWMKSLCREIVDLLDAGHVEICRGTAPSRDDVNDLPGRFLLNPGAHVPTSMPMFEDEYEAWKDRLSRTGG